MAIHFVIISIRSFIVLSSTSEPILLFIQSLHHIVLDFNDESYIMLYEKIDTKIDQLR